jgi:transposase
VCGKESIVFLRAYTKTKDGKPHTYYALVESVRTDAGPRQQIVAYLGELNHDQQRRWQRTVVFHNRQGETQQLRLYPDDSHVPLPDDPDILRIRLSSVGWTNARHFGDVYLARWLWQMLKLDEIVDRHLPQGKHTVRPADIVAIEVINRLCAPCSEFALAEHWYASTALEELLGVPDSEVTKDRLYRTLDTFREAKDKIESDLKDQLGRLFQLEYDLLLYDITSTYFEGLAEDNALAKRGYSRDQRSDCKQVILALVVTREGFPVAHFTLAGNTQDVETVEKIVQQVEQRYGRAAGVWVMDRGMVSKDKLKFLSRPGRRYVIALRRTEVVRFQKQLGRKGWQALKDRPEVQVKPVRRGTVNYLLVRSRSRRQKERAIRRRQYRALADGLKRLEKRVSAGQLKKRDKILERVGYLRGKYPKGRPFVTISVTRRAPMRVEWSWHRDKFKEALTRDGVYILRSNERWKAEEFWQTYMQLTVVERAFRVLKSELLLRPVWHHYSGRTEAHIFVCVLAYALWKTLDHLLKQSGLMTEIHKPDPERPDASPKARPMTPEVALRELSRLQIGDIQLESTDGRIFALRRVGRPNAEQKRILAALQVELPERFSSDRIL